MDAVVEGTNNGVFHAGVSIGECASAANVRLHNKIGLTIASACAHTLDIFGEIDGTVLDTLGFFSTIVLLLEKSGLPSCSHLQIVGTRSVTSFELIPVVGVLREELHVLIDMNMDDDRHLVHYVISNFNKVVLVLAQQLDPLQEEISIDLV